MLRADATASHPGNEIEPTCKSLKSEKRNQRNKKRQGIVRQRKKSKKNRHRRDQGRNKRKLGKMGSSQKLSQSALRVMIKNVDFS